MGVGSTPFYASGKAYFAGPYEGDPFSVVFVTPAVAGPFDLGDVVVRAGIQVNPETAEISVKTDAIPQILDGVPLAGSFDRSEHQPAELRVEPDELRKVHDHNDRPGRQRRRVLAV